MRVVTSYVNPDLDGVSSAIAYAQGLPSADVVITGVLNRETSVVLAATGLADALRVEDEPSWASDIVLVDCHHPLQLPRWVDCNQVSVVIDHHPDGSPGAFPNAIVHNEAVGAAATLVFELGYRARGRAPDARQAALLACGIRSSTLDFKAPSTVDRDLSAYEQLEQLAADEFDLDWLGDRMREARRELLEGTSAEILARDVKVVSLGRNGLVAISQVEASGASELAERLDLAEALQCLRSDHEVAHALVSCVDTAAETTTMVSESLALLRDLSRLESAVYDEWRGRVTVPYIALRKSHLVPALQKASG